MKALSAFLAGLMFSLGLVLSGMTQPGKVVDFLDITGNWDPSLAFVMLGAIAVHAISQRWITRRAAPLFAAEFHVPGNKHLDRRLLLGAAIFGVGWALSGYCPGPAVVALGAGSRQALLFVGTMVLGMLGFFLFQRRSMGPR